MSAFTELLEKHVPYASTSRDDDEQPQFAAHISIKAGITMSQTDYDICSNCLQALRALTQGRFRR